MLLKALLADGGAADVYVLPREFRGSFPPGVPYDASEDHIKRVALVTLRVRRQKKSAPTITPTAATPAVTPITDV